MCRSPYDAAVDWFYEHRKVDFDTGCWELDTAWVGAKGSVQNRIPRSLVRALGYPVLTNSSAFRSRKLSAVLFKGLDGNSREPIFVTCGNAKCCNYEHLTVGQYHPLATKTCPRCNRNLPAKVGFYWYGDRPSGYCKECFRAYIKKWNRKATEKRQTAKRRLNRQLDRRGLLRREQGAARKVGVRSGVVSLLRVLQRDKEICHICLHPISDPATNLHFDHVVPFCRGGLHEESNVKLAHVECNLWKGVALMSELELLGLADVRNTGQVPAIRYSRVEYLLDCIVKARISR